MADDEPEPFLREFPSTHWTTILHAGGDSAARAEALDKLCRRYCAPIEGFIRWRLRQVGGNADDAREVTQEFFLHLLEKEKLRNLRRDGPGRFRTWIKEVAVNFHINLHKYQTAAKRGGKRAALPLDETTSDGLAVAPDLAAAEMELDRQWARTLFGNVLQELRQWHGRNSSARVFDALKPYLALGTPPYAELASTLGMSPGALRVKYSRMFKDFLKLVRRAVADTVKHPDDVDEELRYLCRLLPALGAEML